MTGGRSIVSLPSHTPSLDTRYLVEVGPVDFDPDASPWFPLTPPSIQSRVYADANERMGVSWYDYGAFPASHFLCASKGQAFGLGLG